MKSLSLLIVLLSFANPSFAQTQKPVAKKAPAKAALTLDMRSQYIAVAINSTAEKVKAINSKIRESNPKAADLVLLATPQQMEDIVSQLNIPRDTVAIVLGVEWAPIVGKEAKPEFNGSKWFTAVTKEAVAKDLGVLITEYNKYGPLAMSHVKDVGNTVIQKIQAQSAGAEL